MASPFAVFRKRQKAMLVLLGVLLMLAFLVVPIVMQLLDETSTVRNPLVVSTRYGDVFASDLERLRRQRQLANAFLSQAQAEANSTRAVAQPFGAPTDESLLLNMLLTRKAAEMGIVVSDEAVHEFIREETENRVDRQNILALLRHLGTSWSAVQEALRGELLADRVRQLLFAELPAGAPTWYWEQYYVFQAPAMVPPQLRWDYYRRFYQQASIEAIGIPVERFLDKTSQPSRAELEEFFNKYRDKPYVIGSPDPGFYQPKRAKFEYLKVDFNTYFEKAKAAATDEQLRAYYEEHKQDYPYQRFMTEPPSPAIEEPANEDTPEKTDDPAAPEGEQPDEKTKPSNDEPADAPKENPPAKDDSPDKNDSPDKPKASDDTSGKPGDQPPAEEGAARPLPGDELLALADSEAPAAEAAAENEPPAAADDGNAPQPAKSSNEDAADKAPPQPAASSPDGEQPTDEKPADDESTEEPPADKPSDESSAEGKPADDKPATPPAPKQPKEPVPYPLEDDILQGPDPEHAPFWQVKDRVRDDFARQQAQREVDEVMQQIRQPMDVYYRLRLQETSPPPPDFTLEELAAKHPGVSAHRTELISAQEAGEYTDIGKSVVDRGAPFVVFAYQNLLEYTPQAARDNNGNGYVFWLLEQKQAFVPEFTDEGIAAEVERQYRLIQARQLAQQAAEEMAAKARQEHLSLAEVFPNEKVIQPPAFSWLSITGEVFQGRALPPLGNVEGVERPGNHFMETVFNLSPGGVGVALNNPQTVVYVVRLRSKTPSDAELRNSFVTDRFASLFSNQAASIQKLDLLQNWHQALLEEARVVWHRPAERFEE